MTPREVELRQVAEQTVFFGQPATRFVQTMVYADTGETVDVLAEHPKLSIFGYMVKIKVDYLRHPDAATLPAGGIVKAIDEQYVTVEDAELTREAFLEMYEVD